MVVDGGSSKKNVSKTTHSLYIYIYIIIYIYVEDNSGLCTKESSWSFCHADFRLDVHGSFDNSA